MKMNGSIRSLIQHRMVEVQQVRLVWKPSQTQSATTEHNNTIQTTKASGNSANASADLLAAANCTWI
ncbi:MAG: hypothetical protein ACLS9K_03475 [Lachnospira eligens]